MSQFSFPSPVAPAPLSDSKFSAVELERIKILPTVVAQATSTTTAVTANGTVGIVTAFASTLAADAAESYTVNNTNVGVGSSVLISVSGYTGTMVTNGVPMAVVTDVAEGSFVVNIVNVGTAALAGQVTITFLV